VGDLLEELGFDRRKVRAYETSDDFADALSKGSKNGGIAAVIHEVPYIKIFLFEALQRLHNGWTNLQIRRLWLCKLTTPDIFCAKYLRVEFLRIKKSLKEYPIKKKHTWKEQVKLTKLLWDIMYIVKRLITKITRNRSIQQGQPGYIFCNLIYHKKYYVTTVSYMVLRKFSLL
jgi:hypothetical protein